MGKEIWLFLLITFCLHHWQLAVLVSAGIELTFFIGDAYFRICGDDSFDIKATF